jgi:hypothetical protein
MVGKREVMRFLPNFAGIQGTSRRAPIIGREFHLHAGPSTYGFRAADAHLQSNLAARLTSKHIRPRADALWIHLRFCICLGLRRYGAWSFC